MSNSKVAAAANDQNENQQNTKAQIAQFQARVVQTNIVPPEILEQFEHLVPGSAEKIINSTFEETRIRREQEKLALEANISAQDRQLKIAEFQSKAVFRSDLFGQMAGLIVCLSCIAGSVYIAIENPNSWEVATALAALPTAAVIKAFLVSPGGNRVKAAQKEQKKGDQ